MTHNKKRSTEFLPSMVGAPSSGNLPTQAAQQDPLFNAVRQLVIETQNPSVAFVQRHFKLGHDHAVRLLSALEGHIVTAVGENGLRNMMALGTQETRHPTVKLAVVDVETTGFDPLQDELLALSVVCVEVDRVSGELVKIIDNYTGQREPTRPMSPAVEQLLGISAADLAGHVLDVVRISAMLEGCELVVAHNAAFDRSFIESHVPSFRQLAWGCSLRDIDWFGAEKQPKASIEHLAILYGIESSNGTPQADCNALVRAMSMPLPVSGITGFAALLASAHLPR